MLITSLINLMNILDNNQQILHLLRIYLHLPDNVELSGYDTLFNLNINFLKQIIPIYRFRNIIVATGI